jgi:hypothetical protein
MEDQVSFPYTAQSVQRNVKLSNRTKLIISISFTILALIVFIISISPAFSIFGSKQVKIPFYWVTLTIFISSVVATILILLGRTQSISKIIGPVLLIEIGWQIANDITDDITLPTVITIVFIGSLIYSRRTLIFYALGIELVTIFAALASAESSEVIVEFIANATALIIVIAGILLIRMSALDRAKSELLETNRELDSYKTQVTRLTGEVNRFNKIFQRHPELLKEQIELGS